MTGFSRREHFLRGRVGRRELGSQGLPGGRSVFAALIGEHDAVHFGSIGEGAEISAQVGASGVGDHADFDRFGHGFRWLRGKGGSRAQDLCECSSLHPQTAATAPGRMVRKAG